MGHDFTYDFPKERKTSDDSDDDCDLENHLPFSISRRNGNIRSCVMDKKELIEEINTLLESKLIDKIMDSKEEQEKNEKAYRSYRSEGEAEHDNWRDEFSYYDTNHNWEDVFEAIQVFSFLLKEMENRPFVRICYE